MTELTLSNWKESPPMPWTGRVSRRWVRWEWSLSTEGKVVTGGKCWSEARAWRDMMCLMHFATTV